MSSKFMKISCEECLAKLKLTYDRYWFSYEGKGVYNPLSLLNALKKRKQIEEKRYALPYAADARKVYKVGVNFNSDIRNISEWKVRE